MSVSVATVLQLSCYFVRWYWKRAWLRPKYQQVTGNQQIHQTDLHNTHYCAFTPVGIWVSFRDSMTQKPLSTVYYRFNSSCFRRHVNTLFSRLSLLLTKKMVSSTCNRYSCLKNDSCMIYVHPYHTSSFKSKTCNMHIFQIHRTTKWRFLSFHVGNSYDSDFALIYVTKLTGTKVRRTVLRRCSY